MASRLAGRLARVPAPGRVLELGCGTGYLTGLLDETFPGAEIVAVDLAERMVEVARARVRSPRVAFRVADAETADLGGGFDLVVSNAAIQWFCEPELSVPRLAEAVRPGGLMLHATFGPATLSELRVAFAENGRSPAGLPLRPGEQWEQVFAGSGLEQVGCQGRLEVEHYPAAADLLRELQATGVTTRPGGEAGPMAPRSLQDGLRRYEERFRSRRGVPATWETLELSGVRPA